MVFIESVILINIFVEKIWCQIIIVLGNSDNGFNVIDIIVLVNILCFVVLYYLCLMCEVGVIDMCSNGVEYIYFFMLIVLLQ